MIVKISEVKLCLDDSELLNLPSGVQTTNGNERNLVNSQRPDLFLGKAAYQTKGDLINAMPAKESVDGLVSQWFNSKDSTACKYFLIENTWKAQRDWIDIIHAPTFQDEVSHYIFVRNYR